MGLPGRRTESCVCLCVCTCMHAYAGEQGVCQGRVGDERTEVLMTVTVLAELEQ